MHKDALASSTKPALVRFERSSLIAIFGLPIPGGSDRLGHADLNIVVEKWIVEIVSPSRRRVMNYDIRPGLFIMAGRGQPEFSNCSYWTGHGGRSLHIEGDA
jgi:hypothetical protein